MKAKIMLGLVLTLMGTAFGITVASHAPIGKPVLGGPIPICPPPDPTHCQR